MDAQEKLTVLAESSRYDLSCACKLADEPGRQRGVEGQWIYPAALPDGRRVFLLKTLQSNQCVNDCSYCPFNRDRNVPRCSMAPDQLAAIFDQLHRAGLVQGLFLTSGVVGSADQTMERMLATVDIIRRRYGFRGFVHLKIIPGASQAAIEAAVRLATRVSVNIETPSARRMAVVSQRKRFHEDIIRTMEGVRQAAGGRQSRGCPMTSQFVVGAAGETDREIVLATHRLYRKLGLERVYFSAYQAPNGPPRRTTLFEDDIVMGKTERSGTAAFMREHRLYQVDFLFRRYGFDLEDIETGPDGQLDLAVDPKTRWAWRHRGLFPIDVNTADRWLLLRVPGIGPGSVAKILKYRRESRFRTLGDLRRIGVRTKAAAEFLTLPEAEAVPSGPSLFGEL